MPKINRRAFVATAAACPGVCPNGKTHAYRRRSQPAYKKGFEAFSASQPCFSFLTIYGPISPLRSIARPDHQTTGWL